MIELRGVLLHGFLEMSMGFVSLTDEMQKFLLAVLKLRYSMRGKWFSQWETSTTEKLISSLTSKSPQRIR